MLSHGHHVLASVLALLVAAALFEQADAHRHCPNDFELLLNTNTKFCPTDDDVLYADNGIYPDNGICCDAAMEDAIMDKLASSDAAGTCAAMYKEVLCTACHPWAGHLYERLGNGLTMKKEFCDDFYDECSGDLDLSSNYCDIHAEQDVDGNDQYYSYPYTESEGTFDGKLIEAFTEIDLPKQPIDMRMTPDGTKWWIIGMEGEIVEIDVSDPEKPPTSTKVVLDISGDDNLLLSTEEGLFSVAFSPGFHTTGVFYASYSPPKRDGSARGFNRLSRFQYYPSNAQETRNSEEVVLDTVDKNFIYHAAGWLGFKPSAYGTSDPDGFHDLYWSMGDSGNQLDDGKNAQNPNTQHGSILRISVDSKMGSPIKIPEGNPFKNGGGLPEICAQGFRNPHKCSFDRATDELWCGDVGNYEVESIKKIECGKNYGWRQFEGHRCTLEIDDWDDNDFEKKCADSGVRNPYTFPEFSYCHSDHFTQDEADYAVPNIPNDDFCGDRSVVGSAVIGGFVYRGKKYADLFGGHYLFADYQMMRLYHLFPKADGWGTADGTKYGYGTIKESGFINAVSFAEANNGELYVIKYKGGIYELPCGDLCSDPASKDYEKLGCAADLTDNVRDAEIADHCLLAWKHYCGAQVMPVGPIDGDPMSAEICQGICAEALPEYQYFGTQYSFECFCAKSLPGDLALNHDGCSSPCKGSPGETCGGSLALSVYQPRDGAPPAPTPVVEGEYGKLGCAEDLADETRVMSVGPIDGDTMSADICYSICAEELPGFEYFGTQYSFECFCSKTLPGDVTFNHNGCTSSCKGNLGETCGGVLALTVYQVGEDVVPPPAPTPVVDGEYGELGCGMDLADGTRVMPVGPIKGDVMSAETCYSICVDELPGFEYFGTQYSFECFCSKTLPGYVTFDHDGCTSTCKGSPGETCGGSNAMTFYQVGDDVEPPPAPTPTIPAPTPVVDGEYGELGCVMDLADGTRVMPVGPIEGDVMSAETCYSICVDELPGFEYFGTQYSFECFCSKTLPGYVTFDHDGCTSTCKGNPGETCGGSNAMTSYQVGDDVEPPPAPTPTIPAPTPVVDGEYGELGCAVDLTDGVRVMPVGPIDGGEMSAEICYSICAEELPDFEYFGTQYSFECFCSKTLPGYVSFSHTGCTSACKGNPEEICGGSSAMTIYEIGDDVNPPPAPVPAPTPVIDDGEYEELGCAVDLADGVRVMPVGPIDGDTMSAQICYDICTEQLPGSAYFGTQYSFECFCAETLPGYVIFDYNGCTSTCEGNAGEICGGSNAITIYQIGDVDL